MHILFPSDYFNKRAPDEAFAEQWHAFHAAGFSCHTFDADTLAAKSIAPSLPDGAVVLYRCYMMPPDQNSDLNRSIASLGATMLTGPDEYALCHHIPNWYPLIQGYTPETAFFPDVDSAIDGLGQLGWDGFFIKDYVKSLKTSLGSQIRDRSQLADVVVEIGDGQVSDIVGWKADDFVKIFLG